MTQLLYIDLFCGAGGTSTGVARARLNGKKCAKVIACVNHDPNAIKSHAANHPDTLHFTEDIRTLDMKPLVSITNSERAKNHNAKVVLWASLECTNFSKAKGGQPRDADSRTLAEHLFRYIEALEPDYIYIENVEEFMCWGELDANGKPVSKDKGILYLRWVKNVCNYGYDFSHRLLNAADYGAVTSRTRFFGIFAKHGLPTVFPEPTHCKGGRAADMFHPALKPWNAVRDVLELVDEGESIFGRKKPLVERTLWRILAGLIKFIAGSKEAYIARRNSVKLTYIPVSFAEPCDVETEEKSIATAQVQFLSKQFSGDPDSKNISIDAPAGTITCKDHHALVTAQFLVDYNYKDTVRPLDKPAPTILTHDKLAISNISFIDAYYGNGHEHSINDPAPVLRCVGHLALVTSHFLDNQYGHGAASSIAAPSPTITNTPKQKLISVERGQFVMNPAYQSKGSSIDAPCFTLVARMDKTPPYLISTERGDICGVIIYDTDSPAMRNIKEFMAMYGIIDIKMRMLNIPELKRIMGFGTDYTLIGTQTEQKKYIGNAVECHMSQALCEALAAALNK